MGYLKQKSISSLHYILLLVPAVILFSFVFEAFLMLNKVSLAQEIVNALPWMKWPTEWLLSIVQFIFVIGIFTANIDKLFKTLCFLFFVVNGLAVEILINPLETYTEMLLPAVVISSIVFFVLSFSLTIFRCRCVHLNELTAFIYFLGYISPLHGSLLFATLFFAILSEPTEK